MQLTDHSSEYWKMRAQHERMLAQEVESDIARSVHFRMAAKYDELAKEAESAEVECLSAEKDEGQSVA